jgi:hypothetical protein
VVVRKQKYFYIEEARFIFFINCILFLKILIIIIKLFFYINKMNSYNIQSYNIKPYMFNTSPIKQTSYTSPRHQKPYIQYTSPRHQKPYIQYTSPRQQTPYIQYTSPRQQTPYIQYTSPRQQTHYIFNTFPRQQTS